MARRGGASERKSSYECKFDDDDLAELTAKLNQDLKMQIRRMDTSRVLSAEWVQMADTVGRIASISEMEAKLPKKQEQATLWECEELALRIVLEEGKLNLCLRNLVTFIEFERVKRQDGFEGLSDDQISKMDKFEKGLGLLLRNAWRHIEALQTTDLSLLLSHIVGIITETCKSPEFVEKYAKAGELHERQEILVFYYLHGVVSNMEEINEAHIMRQLRGGFFMSMLSMLDNYWVAMRDQDLLIAVECLAFILASEDFQTYEEHYIDTNTDDTMSRLHSSFLDRMSGDYDVRRKIRPVLDYARRCQYK
mmetsp:Transcript_60052/g.82235  ORF Transcript_60052/g.82235 Transcript_60052/m.82235 type:complete len:308 (-) Transcript_60052:614-1537(-)|eukprot:CAMPEP_0185758406 /NCGR_PEP_ID=MMETSP1174-20130828/17057_1 /TAXON_ID=35687 /ORGANISM="Dictyocha speculum, Strain CCMP1381" /LENGTH=307 /DNA_ID=CAMNT_0028438243 /DNA_START=44 /DNA_END=967 /DNA_ORIENTATION=+